MFETLQAVLRPWAQDLFDLAQRAGVQPRVTSTTRSHAKQQALYERWRQGLQPYPVAVPGTSAHEYGYAFDMTVRGPVNQLDLGNVWISWQGVYGGQADPVHFEFPDWRSLVDASEIIPAGPGPPPSTLRRTLEQAVDQALHWLPTPIRGIVNTAQLATTIYEWSGRSPDLVTYWLAHPQEYFDAVFSLLWSLVRAEVAQQF